MLQRSDAAVAAPARRPLSDRVGRVAFWVGLAVVGGAWVTFTRGAATGAEYFAAYLLELSLSVDNIFVFVVAFSELGIPAERRRRVLRWGIAGALVFRAGMIGGGIALAQRFDWTRYVFAGLVLLAAWRTLMTTERQRQFVEDVCRVCSTWIARVIPVSPGLDGPHFWRRQRGRLVATPLLVALVVIETTDVVFALDSVPAVLAITRNPLIVYSSNVLAMVALRSLYFVVADALGGLRYLPQGIATILVFTAVKMMAAEWVEIGPVVSIAVIVLVLGAAVLASRLRNATPPGVSRFRNAGLRQSAKPALTGSVSSRSTSRTGDNRSTRAAAPRHP
jgi:tellurite resistance protein TerC